LRRGDLVTVALPGDFGKPRPAVVVQSDLFAGHATVTVLPVTSTVTPPAPLFRLPLDPSARNGLQAPSCVMVDKTMSVRAGKLGSTIGRLDEVDMVRINRAMALFLGIAP
jgi:mRNA interferase MazF